MLGKLFGKDKKAPPAPDGAGSTTQEAPAPPGPKRSLYRRYEDAKKGRSGAISDEDLKKYTGMDRAALGAWSQGREGVAANQRAGDITAGGTSGFGLGGTAGGLGGWGPSAGEGLKYPPPRVEGKTLEDDE